MRKSNKEFMPVWGWCVVVSFCLALLTGYLATTGTLNTAYISIRKAMIPAHVIAEQKAQSVRYLSQLDLRLNTTFMEGKANTAVTSARNLAIAGAKHKMLYSSQTHYLTDFEKQMEENAQWIQSISPVPPELTECRDLFVEMLLSMRKMRNCFQASKSNSDYYSMDDYNQIVFFQELKSMIDSSDRLALKLPNVPFPKHAD